MDDGHTDQLKHLRPIRRLLAIQCVLLLVLIAFVVFLGLQWCKHPSASKPSAYRTATDTLYYSGQYDKLLELSKRRIADSPGDGYGYYYAGIASYHLEHYEQAISYLEEAEAIFPVWKDEYTGPMMASAKMKLNMLAQQPDGAVTQEAAPSAAP